MKYLSLVALTIFGLAGSSCIKDTCKNYVSSATCPNTCTWTGSVCETEPRQCSELTDPEFCSLQFFDDAGCYWDGGACAKATVCADLTTNVACSHTSVAGTTCFWNGMVCSSNPPPILATCQGAATIDACLTLGCFWNGAACIQELTQCSDIHDETLCSLQALESGGCYWSNTTCNQAFACSQPTSEVACLGSKQNAAQCSWSGSACYLNSSILGCAGFSTQEICESTSGSDGYCFWTASNSTCSAATSCAQLNDAPICTNAPLKTDGDLCDWSYDTAQACTVNSPIRCTSNAIIGINTTACCAGLGGNCTTTDANCEAPRFDLFNPNFYTPFGQSICVPKTNPECTFNGIASSPACCAGDSGGCGEPNPNCTLRTTSGAGGSCS